jgi:hypothetical protein
VTDSKPRTKDAAPMGVDRAQLLASLRRTPRERFERGIKLARAAAIFRKAKPVQPSR